VSTGTSATGGDVVADWHEAAQREREPLIVVEPLAAFLDEHGLGVGPLALEAIGEGHSNVTYAIRRGPARFVLRRPPRGPLQPSTHDVLREARLLVALRAARMRVPEVVAICDDTTIIGAPFYLMHFVDGHVLSGELPATLDGPGARAKIGEELVDTLVELHALDIEAAGLSGLARSDGYLERQLRRFGALLEQNATRPLPELEAVADWLAAHMPASPQTTVVHGDFRLGNAIFAPAPAVGAAVRPQLVAMLDWEMATLGDPLADLGYLSVSWAERDDPPNPMLDLSGVTRLAGFYDRQMLAQRYAERSGHDLAALDWYRVLALWKAAIFLEGSYQRYLAGSTDDPYFAKLGEGVPVLARLAAGWIERA
jgi:aminoglycoside phosphotransferase (APT) family kinase protein